jgi:hypothetical protein
MKEYRWPLLGLVLVSVVLVRTGVLWEVWPDPISEHSFYRIQPGMTEKEVVDILRRPGVDHGFGIKIWVGQEAIIEVDFDQGSGLVKRKALTPLAPRAPSRHVYFFNPKPVNL